MGGERADVIEVKTAQGRREKGSPIQVTGTTKAGNVQAIRIHESNSQVHFHVDAESLKCAVPVPVWAKAWERLSNPPNSDTQVFTYTDRENETVLYVETGNYVNADGSGYTLDAIMRVHPLTSTNTIYDQLEKFSNPA